MEVSHRLTPWDYSASGRPSRYQWNKRITPAEVAAKVPKDAVNAYVKVEENKIYWTSDKDAGSVDIW